MINSIERAIETLNTQRFLPFFICDIPNFSIEEQVDPILWFNDKMDGPWEWKGPIIQQTKCAYGKFFHKKAGFIEKEMFKHFINLRRDGYDFDARYNDHLASFEDKKVIDTLERLGPSLGKILKEESGVKGFETIITRLQMQGYIVICDFEYKISKQGIPYGWGMARYATVEQYFGQEFVEEAYKEVIEDSYSYIINHLNSIQPNNNYEKFIRG